MEGKHEIGVSTAEPLLDGADAILRKGGEGYALLVSLVLHFFCVLGICLFMFRKEALIKYPNQLCFGEKQENKTPIRPIYIEAMPAVTEGLQWISKHFAEN